MATIIKSPKSVAQVTRDNIGSEERGRLQQLLDEYYKTKSLPAGLASDSIDVKSVSIIENRKHLLPH